MRCHDGVISAIVVVLVVLGSGCGGDDSTSSQAQTASARTTGAPGAASATAIEGGTDVAPSPPLPDPAPALPCDGQAVLCVDIASSAMAPDGSADAPFSSVGEAVAAAGKGSVVQVAAGVYEESLVFAEAEDLTLVGGFPAGDFSARDPAAFDTVLRGSAEAPVIEITASTGVHIEGLRVTGGGGWTDDYNWYGGGIYIDQTSSDVAVVGNRIDDNAVDHGSDPGYSSGGGISSNGTTVTIIGNIIEGNRAGRGGGIAVIGEATVDRNIVRDNLGVGDHGGGLYLAGDITVTANRVEGNQIGVDGYGWAGGIIVFGDDTTATLSGNIVTGNTAPSAGSGVFIDDGADATLLGELYYANECGVDGGNGLFVDSGGETTTVVEVVNATIAQHDCPDSALGGNAILAEVSEPDDTPSEVTVTNSIFWGNAGLDVFSAGADVRVTYTLAETPIEGEGNLSEDPVFVDPAGGDFHLGPPSPAIDAGDPTAPFDAEPDPNGSRIDLGYTGNTSEASGSS